MMKARYYWQRFRWESRREHLALTLAFAISAESLISINLFRVTEIYPNVVQMLLVHIFIGFPLMYMETTIGQFSQLGCLNMAKMAPIGRGLGWTMLIILIYRSITISILMSDILVYLVLSMASELPWMNCIKQVWPRNCRGVHTIAQCANAVTTNPRKCFRNDSHFSAEYFWKYGYKGIVYNVTSETETFVYGHPIPSQMVCLSLAWVLIYALVLQQLKGYENLLWFNMYAFITGLVIILLVVSVVKGFGLGFNRLFTINFDSFLTANAWFLASEQMVKTVALSQGTHIMYGSYLSPKIPSNANAILAVMLVFVLSLLMAMVTHGCLGILVHKTKVPFDMIHLTALEGNELLFILVPQTLGLLGIPQLWTLIYFSSLMLMAITCQVTHVDIVYASLADLYPRAKLYRSYIIGFVCLMNLLLGFPFAVSGGYVLIQQVFMPALVDIICIVLILFTTTVFWLYGVQRLCDDIHFMTGTAPSSFWKISWYLCPIFNILGVFHVVRDVQDESRYRNRTEATKIARVLLDAVFVVPSIFGALYTIFVYLKRHNLIALLAPADDWGPPDADERNQRRLFNPRTAIRARRRIDTCQHTCLHTSRVLRWIVAEELRLRIQRWDELEEKLEDLSPEDVADSVSVEPNISDTSIAIFEIQHHKSPNRLAM